MSTFEITDTKNMSIEDATNVISEHYHDKLTYKGIEFFDSIYMSAIINIAERELNPNNGDGQESYLGYLPEEDIFISGWDTWENDYYDDELDEYRSNGNSSYFIGNVAYIKIDESGNAFIVKIDGCAGDMMYGRNGSLEHLKAKHKNLIDIRLD